MSDHAQGRPARDVAVQIGGRLANLVLAVFVTILVVRSLGDVRYGQWAALLAVIALAAAACDLGFRQVAVRRAAAEPEFEEEWIGALLQLRAALSIIAWLAGTAAVLAIARDTEMRAAGLLLSSTLLLAAAGAFTATFQLRVRNDLAIVVMTAQNVLWAVAAIVVLSLGGSLVPLAVGFAFALLVSSVLQVALGLRVGGARLRGARRYWPDMIRVGLPLAVGSALILAYGRIDQILVLELAGSRDAGLYAAVYRIFDQAQFVAISVTTTVLPLLAASFGVDVTRFRRVLQSAVDVLLAFAIASFAFVSVYAQELVILLFGDDFRESADALVVLVAALIPVSLGYMLGILVIVTGMQRAFAVVALAGLAFNVSANLALIPLWGFFAAACITLVTEVLVLVLTWLVVRPNLPVAIEAGRTARIAGAGLATVAALIALRAASAPVVVAAVVFAVLFAVFAFAFRAVRRSELQALWRTATGTT